MSRKLVDELIQLKYPSFVFSEVVSAGIDEEFLCTAYEYDEDRDPKPSSEISKLYTRLYNLHDADVEKELEKILNEQEKVSDYGHWTTLAYWTAEQAAALSIDVLPEFCTKEYVKKRSQNRVNIGTHKNPPQYYIDYLTRYQILKSHEQLSEKKHIDIDDWLNIFTSNNLDYPKEFDKKTDSEITTANELQNKIKELTDTVNKYENGELIKGNEYAYLIVSGLIQAHYSKKNKLPTFHSMSVDILDVINESGLEPTRETVEKHIKIAFDKFTPSKPLKSLQHNS